MDLHVAKWGNSLALRIPAEVVRRLGLREGATVEAQLTVDGTLPIRPARWNRKAFALELAEARNATPMCVSVMTDVREKRELVAAARRVPEFASALGIKQRTGAIDAQQAQVAWQRFERMAAADLRLRPVGPANFLRAAKLVLDAARALCAGDALTDADKRGKTTIQWSFGGRSTAMIGHSAACSEAVAHQSIRPRAATHWRRSIPSAGVRWSDFLSSAR